MFFHTILESRGDSNAKQLAGISSKNYTVDFFVHLCNRSLRNAYVWFSWDYHIKNNHSIY